jgi:hypothetical protein
MIKLFKGRKKRQKFSLLESDEVGWARLEDDDFLLALTMAQLIWLRRNSSVFGKEFSHPLQVSRAAMEAVETFKSANHSYTRGSATSS